MLRAIILTVMFVEFIFVYHILVVLQLSELQEKGRTKLAFDG